MTQLSTNFQLEEFQKDSPIPDECVRIFRRLCVEILEPARAFADGPFDVTSGYRDPQANADAHGQPNSDHLATPRRCAGDGTFGAKNRAVFDWMRNNPKLPFHQLILEHDASGGSIIHVSINEDMQGVRSVLEGFTHNAGKYTPVDHVAYNPDVPPLAPDLATQV